MRPGPEDDTEDATRVTPPPARGDTLGAPGAGPPPRSSGDPLRVGARLEERYVVEGVLGRGGMGVVLAARDVAAGRRVAVKVVLGVTPARVERFRREGRIMAALRHPGLLTVHSAGVSDAGPYLVVDLVEGARGLDEAFQGASLERRVAWVRDAARALGVAHARGVVHRDVKPQNLLVDADGWLRVADFGLAVADDLTRLTETGALVGTPEFMAPEQVRDQLGDVGPAADVWALGVVLFEALTGERPFSGNGVIEVLAAVCRADVPAPSSRAPGVPPALDAVCLRALRRDPAARYPDGEALARDLDAWLQGAVTTAERERGARSRRAGGLVALGALGLLVVAGLALGAWRAAGTAEDAAALEADAAEVLAATRPLVDDAPAIEALARRAERLPEDASGARGRVVALLGLLRLAQGDLAGAEAAAAASLAGPPDDAAVTALRGALAAVTTAADPARARVELTRAIGAGVARPELRAWRARARGRGGVATSADADAILTDLEAAGDAWRDDGELRAQAHLRRGDVASAWSAVLALEGVETLRWAVGLRRAQAAFEADELAAAAAALEEAGPAPSGDPAPEALTLRSRAVTRVERALGPLEAGRLDRAQVDDLLALVRVAHLAAPARPLPATVLGPLTAYATSPVRRADEFAAAVLVAELAPDDAAVQRAVAMSADTFLDYERSLFIPAVRRALAAARSQAERDTFEVQLCRLLAFGYAESTATDCVELAGRLLERLDDPSARRDVLYARAIARVTLRELDAALADCEAALALEQAGSARLWLLRAQLLEDVGRFDDASAAAEHYLRTADLTVGTNMENAVLVIWAAQRRAGDLERARAAVAALVAERPAHGGWGVRLAWLEQRLGAPGAAGTLRRAARRVADMDELRHLAADAAAAADALEAGAPDAARRLDDLVGALEAARGHGPLP